MSHKRVYHPTLNSWQDVPEDAVSTWTKAGWSEKRPQHVDDSDTLPPGAFFVAPVARPELVEAAQEPAKKKVEPKADEAK